MSEFGVLALKEMLEQWRTKKILILVIVFLFVAIASPIIAKITPELLKNVTVPGMILNLPAATFIDSLDQFIKNTSQIALLVLVFVVAGAVSDEKNKKTLEILLTKPVSRVNFIFSKFTGYFLSISAVYAASALIFYFYTVSTFSSFSFANFSVMALLVLLYILMIVSVTILASTLVKNSIGAGAIGFVFFILFGTIFGLIKRVEKYSPNLIFSKYQSVVASGWSHELLVPTLLVMLMIVVSIASATLLFKKQEIER